MRVASLKKMGLCWCVAWALRGRSCGRYASTRESDSIRQLSLQSKFLPFRERYSPPNPESASIGRNLGWRNCLFRRRSKKTSKLRVTGLCVGNSPGTGEFPAEMASYAENVSIWWCHHVLTGTPMHTPVLMFHNHNLKKTFRERQHPWPAEIRKFEHWLSVAISNSYPTKFQADSWNS